MPTSQLTEVAAPGARARWQRAKRQLAAAETGTVLLAAVCIALLVLDAPNAPVAGIVLVAAVLPAAAHLFWLVRSGLRDPGRWPRAVLLTGGVQFVAGVLPVPLLTGQARGAVPAIAGAAVVAASSLLAHRARRVVLHPLVPELGSTALRLRFPLRTSGPVTARLVVDRDQVSWDVRSRAGRTGGAELTIPFHRLRGVKPTSLVDSHQPWLVFPNGTEVTAEPGPAVLLRTDEDEHSLPVHDANLLVDVINRRLHQWRFSPADQPR